MRRLSSWLVVAAVSLAVVGVGSATAQVNRKAPVSAVKPLTADQVRAMPVDMNQKPRLFAVRALAYRTPPEWNGPDLQPKVPITLGSGSAAAAGCTNYPVGSGFIVPWRVMNIGKAPTVGPITMHVTCEVINMPPNAPADLKQAYDTRICGCMRKDFTWSYPPPLAPNDETMQPKLGLFSWAIGPCNVALHPRVTARVVPAGEGPATANNTLVYDICQ